MCPHGHAQGGASPLRSTAIRVSASPRRVGEPILICKNGRILRAGAGVARPHIRRAVGQRYRASTHAPISPLAKLGIVRLFAKQKPRQVDGARWVMLVAITGLPFLPKRKPTTSTASRAIGCVSRPSRQEPRSRERAMSGRGILRRGRSSPPFTELRQDAPGRGDQSRLAPRMPCAPPGVMKRLLG